jgi:hypothetical protein
MPAPAAVPFAPRVAAVIMFRRGRAGDRDRQRHRNDDEQAESNRFGRHSRVAAAEYLMIS